MSAKKPNKKTNNSVQEKRGRGRPRKTPRPFSQVLEEEANNNDGPASTASNPRVRDPAQSIVVIDSDSEDENVELDVRFIDIEKDIEEIANEGAISVGDILDIGVCRDIDIQGVPYEYKRSSLPNHIRSASHTLSLVATTDFKKVLDGRVVLREEFNNSMKKLTNCGGNIIEVLLLQTKSSPYLVK